MQAHSVGESALGSAAHGDRVPQWLEKWAALVGGVGWVGGRVGCGGGDLGSAVGRHPLCLSERWRAKHAPPPSLLHPPPDLRVFRRGGSSFEGGAAGRRDGALHPRICRDRCARALCMHAAWTPTRRARDCAPARAPPLTRTPLSPLSRPHSLPPLTPPLSPLALTPCPLSPPAHPLPCPPLPSTPHPTPPPEAKGVVQHRLQNVVVTLDKVKMVLQRVAGQPQDPCLRLLSDVESVEHLWAGEGRDGVWVGTLGGWVGGWGGQARAVRRAEACAPPVCIKPLSPLTPTRPPTTHPRNPHTHTLPTLPTQPTHPPPRPQERRAAPAAGVRPGAGSLRRGSPFCGGPEQRGLGGGCRGVRGGAPPRAHPPLRSRLPACSRLQGGLCCVRCVLGLVCPAAGAAWERVKRRLPAPPIHHPCPPAPPPLALRCGAGRAAAADGGCGRAATGGSGDQRRADSCG